MVVTAPAEWERVKGFMRRTACTRAGEPGDLMWVRGRTRYICTGWSWVSKNPVGGEGSVERHLP